MQKILNKASGILFSSALIVAQIRYLPFAILSGLSTLTSLFLYFFAYILWLLACRLYPDHPSLKSRWYGFTEFKNQHAAAALLGGMAVIFSIIAFFFPIAIIPACWLFALSNVIWVISEYHKKQNPMANDKEYSSSRQTAYLHYAALLTAMSLITALATTITLVFPGTIAVITVTVATGMGVFLATLAIQKWVSYCLMDHLPDSNKGSYHTMFAQNGFSEKNNECVIEIEIEPSISATIDQENTGVISENIDSNLKEINNEQDCKESDTEDSLSPRP